MDREGGVLGGGWTVGKWMRVKVYISSRRGSWGVFGCWRAYCRWRVICWIVGRQCWVPCYNNSYLISVTCISSRECAYISLLNSVCICICVSRGASWQMHFTLFPCTSTDSSSKCLINNSSVYSSTFYYSTSSLHRSFALIIFRSLSYASPSFNNYSRFLSINYLIFILYLYLYYTTFIFNQSTSLSRLFIYFSITSQF